MAFSFRSMSHRSWLIALVAVLALAVGTSTAFAGKKATIKVSVRMDFFAAGYHSWAVVAQEKGWYEQEGLEVEFQEGQGSSSTSQLVASGQTTFGFVSPIAAIQTIAGGGKIKYIFGLHQKDGSGVMVPAGRGITQPKDLEGKSCAISPFGYIHQLLPAFFAKSGIDSSKVKVVTVPFDALLPSVADGRLDAHCESLSWGEPISLATKYNQKPTFIPFAKYGVAPMGHGIIVNQAFLDSNPEAVKGFLRASLKGIRYAADNPKLAVELLHSKVKAFNTIDGDVRILKATKNLWRVKNTQGKPLGWMNRANWITTVNLMRDYVNLKVPPGLEQVYTNDHVPGWNGNPLPK